MKKEKIIKESTIKGLQEIVNSGARSPEEIKNAPTYKTLFERMNTLEKGYVDDIIDSILNPDTIDNDFAVLLGERNVINLRTGIKVDVGAPKDDPRPIAIYTGNDKMVYDKFINHFVNSINSAYASVNVVRSFNRDYDLGLTESQIDKVATDIRRRYDDLEYDLSPIDLGAEKYAIITKAISGDGVFEADKPSNAEETAPIFSDNDKRVLSFVEKAIHDFLNEKHEEFSKETVDEFKKLFSSFA